MANSHRIYEVTGITAFTAVEIILGVRVVHAMVTPADAALVALACVIGYIAADFSSGVVHWMFDRYWTVDTPILGANFVRPFREHHVDQQGITRHDFIETNGNNCITTAAVLVPGLLLPLEPGDRVTLFVVTVFISTALAVFATNQFHKWAHTDDPPSWVQALQRWHLILDPVHHRIHHTAPFDQHYCITTGWLNPLLQRLRFFPRVERLILGLTGARPCSGDETVEHT